MSRVFLFHTGSIKSLAAMRAEQAAVSFLFHTGSIKSQPFTRKIEFLDRVSIPYWFD